MQIPDLPDDYQALIYKQLNTTDGNATFVNFSTFESS